MPCPKNTNLAEFIANQVAQNDAFTLLQSLAIWLRQRKGKFAPERMALLIDTLEKHPELCTQIAELLGKWLGSMRLYPLLISAGIFSRKGFRGEFGARLYEYLNPAYKDPNDLRDVFALLFVQARDSRWIHAIEPKMWARLFHLIWQKTTPQTRETLRRYVRWEGFHAIEMLSIWVAAEALEPDLVRLDPKLLGQESAFVAFKREVALWLHAHVNRKDFDDSHLQVMLQQCRDKVDRLRKLGTGTGAGSSMAVAHLLERLEQTFNRIVLLLEVFSREKPRLRCLLKLADKLACASAEQHSATRLWKRSVGMLSRSITQNTSDHGEHYITRTKKEYMGMVWSAAGGGVLIALMALFKIIYIGRNIENPFAYGVASGLNYGLGFMLIFMLHFTVATKQPAMTAARFAAAVERNEKGRAVDKKLAQLLIDVVRSQVAAVAGNVIVAMSVAMLVAVGYRLAYGTPILTEAEAAYQTYSVNPWGATLWYAAIAGLWLFCSGIISGYFDNRCDYLNLRMRLRQHPVLKRLLPEKLRGKVADYMHKNYGSLMGNLCFGMLLGMTAFVGHALGLPLDIRHVAFSSANIGYATVAGNGGLLVFLQSFVFVLLIGGVNLMVSFALTLRVALRAREAKIESWWSVFKCGYQLIKEKPLSLILPVGLEDGTEMQPEKV
ncbi:site-specific recombinase [Kingella negevensis]|uniref:site-specific recombinase n=1 Tax=Kingella negevensis TaxID=1522312 RepID=UPI00254DD213|nr:recombinase [Kingella negevensis]MDK4679429.1 recombinase [Kingella negevensis]MDK4682853.1 recombinase [Kingella negevensis]MDK4691050.1 recombinase [Kingella negevensis]MDK4693803.1 recombinase [Kingella negevensis]MDK4700291.1 recombinase [Kingella negevensis]